MHKAVSENERGTFSTRHLVRDQLAQTSDSFRPAQCCQRKHLVQTSLSPQPRWHSPSTHRRSALCWAQAGEAETASQGRAALRARLSSQTATSRSSTRTSKALSNHTNPINWGKNEQMNPNAHLLSLHLPKLQQPQASLPSFPGSESLVSFCALWASSCLSLNPCDWFHVFCLHSGAYQWAEFRSLCKHTHRHVQQPGTGLFPRMQSSARKYQTGSEGHPRVGAPHGGHQKSPTAATPVNRAPVLPRPAGCRTAFTIATLH